MKWREKTDECKENVFCIFNFSGFLLGFFPKFLACEEDITCVMMCVFTKPCQKYQLWSFLEAVCAKLLQLVWPSIVGEVKLKVVFLTHMKTVSLHSVRLPPPTPPHPTPPHPTSN